MSDSFEEGKILLINKPLNWTSFDVVKKLRNVLKVKKIGHAGTLDPLATGLLIIGTGKFTKKLSELQGLDKCYEGVFEVGKTTPSFDLETDFDSENAINHLSDADFERARNSLLGLIKQVPPAHSAVKINGERAYKRARQKKEVKLEPREVTIHDFVIDSNDLPNVSFQIKCSKGTYIRSMARDFGEQLGVGAYLKQLIRTQVGPYRLEDAYELDAFIKMNHESS